VIDRTESALAAYPFKGRIENEILTHARELLA
jgi:hypothetical protein